MYGSRCRLKSWPKSAEWGPKTGEKSVPKSEFIMNLRLKSLGEG